MFQISGRILPIIAIFGLLYGCNQDSFLGLIHSPCFTFQGEKALDYVQKQNNFGPRIPGTPGHTQFMEWAMQELSQKGWQVTLQQTEWKGKPIHNIIAKRGQGYPYIILGAHYDSRPIADQEKDESKRHLPVPGGNDSASGVAVLLELACTLPKFTQGEIWLVLFDAEDSGRVAGYEWIMGSRAFVNLLDKSPSAVVIIDMIGDSDLTIYQEFNSDDKLSQELWEEAAALGYEKFFPAQKKYRMIDDHLPFIEKGIPTALLIDFDYPYWHTTEDTVDKVSTKSLQMVGDVITLWLKKQIRMEQ